MKKFGIILLALFMIVGCSKKMKHKVGLTTTGPDEYKVQKNKPLEVPPHFDLPDFEEKK